MSQESGLPAGFLPKPVEAYDLDLRWGAQEIVIVFAHGWLKAQRTTTVVTNCLGVSAMKVALDQIAAGLPRQDAGNGDQVAYLEMTGVDEDGCSVTTRRITAAEVGGPHWLDQLVVGVSVVHQQQPCRKTSILGD